MSGETFDALVERLAQELHARDRDAVSMLAAVGVSIDSPSMHYARKDATRHAAAIWAAACEEVARQIEDSASGLRAAASEGLTELHESAVAFINCTGMDADIARRVGERSA